jgi:NADPH:quinone reductase-like Zn-dependent oxidoreductase
VQIALRLRAFGGPENFDLTDVPKPAIRPGMALIRVDATSVNQIDVRIRRGQVPIGPDLPTILGADVAGTIEEVGAGVLDFASGDEVYSRAGGPCDVEIVPNCNHFYVGREASICELVSSWLARTLNIAAGVSH